jgi:hypothetical protein
MSLEEDAKYYTYKAIKDFIENADRRYLVELANMEGAIKDDMIAMGRVITPPVDEFFKRLEKIKRTPYARNAVLEFLLRNKYRYIGTSSEAPSRSYTALIDALIENPILSEYKRAANYTPTSKLEMGSLRGGTRKATAVKIRSGDTFHVEHPKKRWTRSKKYKKWLGKLTRKQSKNTQAEDLCIGKKSICKGDLGIPRKYMPQFENMGEIRSFRTFVKKVYKIKSCKARRTARQLRPSQGEISKPRVNAMIKKGVIGNIYFPLVISGDNFVVDGHHRWAAYRLKKPDAKLPVVMIDAPIKDILGLAVAWGAKHHQF